MSQTGPQALSSVLGACADLDAQTGALLSLLGASITGNNDPVIAIQNDTKSIRNAALTLQTLLSSCSAQNAAAIQSAASPGMETLALKSADIVVQQGILTTASSGWASSIATATAAPLAAIQTDALTIQNAVGDLQTAFAACGAATTPALPVPAPFPNAPAPAPATGISRAWTVALMVGGAALVGGLFVRALHRPTTNARA